MRIEEEVEHIVNVNDKNAPKIAMSLNLDLYLKPRLKLFLIERRLTVDNYSVHELRELTKKAIDLKLPVSKAPDDTKNLCAREVG